MRYGHFDDEHREYVITRPDTPVPWINYLGTDAYFGIISNTAGGYSCYRDARLRRITRYRYNNVPADSGGRYLYLRDNGSGDYWSPSWQPTQRDLGSYECRHGLSYTKISSERRGVRAETLYFVPIGETLEVWRLRVRNERDTPADLSVFSSVEFCLWDAQDDATNFQRNYSTGEVEVDGGVIYHKTEYRERRDHFAYFACSEPLAGYDTQREEFLGAYRGWDRPLVVERGESANSVAHGWAPHGSHHVRFLLAPGEVKEVIFLLGYWENPDDQKFDPPGSQILNKTLVRPVIDRWLRPATVAEGFRQLRESWSSLLSVLTVDTPDDDTNRMVNIWNPYQCMVTFNMSRSVSLFESGISRGIGFRDSCQDLLGFVQLAPGRARGRILELAATQLASGGAYHQYQPLTKSGNDAIGSGFNDDPLWLVLGVAAYLKETGDEQILDEPVPYAEAQGTQAPLYEHLERSLQYTSDRLGPHLLPLIGRADWNDCLNLNCFSAAPGESFQTTANVAGGVAESVFIGGLFVLAATEFAQIAERRGRAADAAGYRAEAEKMTGAVTEHGWDGEWFRRAYDHAGRAVGSAENAEGQIFIEPQGICVMGGIGVANGMAARALASVRERLATSHGILLVQPAYTRYHLELGEISSYPPGYKENGSVFCHTNPWVMIAEAMTGNGDAAFGYYKRINPSAREQISDVHRCEPYVYAQMIAGRDAPAHGEAKNSWLTGTAAWNLVAITQWILGIRAEMDGLRVAPVLPAAWAGITATRRFRGATYQISVRNPDRISGWVACLEVDGQRVEGTLVPLAPPGTTVHVEAVIQLALRVPSGFMELHVGCAMWTYAPWQGRYLPTSLSPRDRLRAYATWCNAVEGNTTFYAIPAPGTVRSWAEQTSPDFRFVLKLPKPITHERRLADAGDPLRAFLAAIEPLGKRAHALWIQLPPSFGPADLSALAGFLRNLPDGYRYCVEVRHRAFFTDPRSEQQLEGALRDVGAEWVTFDTTVLFGSPPVSDAEREAWTKKPRLPRRSRALTAYPVVRYIGRDDAARTVAGWQHWLDAVAGWLGEGRSPTVFIHTPDNVGALELARRFHGEVRARVPGVEPLPEPIPAGPPTLF